MDEMTQGQMARMVSGCTKRAAPEPRACPNCDAGRVMADGAGWRWPFCGWEGRPSSPLVCGKCGEEWRETPSPAGIVPVYNAPEPPSPALVNEDGRGEYPVAEAWRGYANAAEERAQEAERRLAAEREAHRALVEAARELVRLSIVEDEYGYTTVGSEELDELRAALEALAALAQEGE